MSHWRNRQPISAPTYDDAVPPPGYIPGYGRGAVGFGTRASSGVVPGYQYTKEDDEADAIFNQIDARMKNRKRKKKKDDDIESKKKQQKTNDKPNVHDQFKDLKAEMSTVSWDEWDAIPDIGDTTVKHHKPERFMPVPEKLILEKVADNKPVLSGVHGLWDVRGQMLENKLDNVNNNNNNNNSDNNNNNGGINADNYLNDLDKSLSRNVGDIKKARQLFTSVRQSNPSYAAGWVAAARLEESAGKIMMAKQIMQDACLQCPKHEDIWIEAARLDQKHNAKVILARGVKHVPLSETLWLKAHELEDNLEQKKTVLRKGLENIPKSEKLWKALVALEDNIRDCKIILNSAVECVPKSVDLWIHLASLSEFERARKVLNKARSNLPHEIQIYISAAHLEEKHNNFERVEKIIRKAYKTIKKLSSSESSMINKIEMDLTKWLKLAESSEKEHDKPITAGSIIRASVGDINNNKVETPVDGGGDGNKDDQTTYNWLEMVDSFINNNAPKCGKALLGFILARKDNASDDMWVKAAEMEDNVDKKKKLLIKKLTGSPNSTLLWNKLIEYEQIDNNDHSSNKNEVNDLLLSTLLQANSNNLTNVDELWLLAIDLAMSRNESMTKINELYLKAKIAIPRNQDLYVNVALYTHKSNKGNNIEKARQILEEGREITGENGGKLWVTSVSLEANTSNNEQTIQTLCQKGIKRCPETPELYLTLSKLEAKISIAKARSTLESGRIKCPRSDQLWLAAVTLERNAGNDNLAKNLMAKALQACPKSGMLHADEIISAPKVLRKAKAFEALKRCDNDKYVMIAVAKMFFDNLMYAKARKWLDRVVAIDPIMMEGGLAKELNDHLKEKKF